MTSNALKLQKKLYQEMVYIRLVEERIADEYHKQEMRCPVHLSVGQEAVPVGISNCLSAKDHVISAHRSHAHYLAKGGDLKGMICELFGKNDGCAKGRGGSMHLIDFDAGVTAAVPIVGSSISIGTGVGFGLSLNSENALAVVYFGDGATEEGVFSESLDFASLMNLPVLFVCENNFYSVYTGIAQRQSAKRDLSKICEGHGIAAIKGDGNDVEEVYAIALDTVEAIRKKNAPVLLELSTYRWLEHCGPNWDDHLGYRADNELKHWMELCPIKKLETKISSQMETSSTFFEEVKTKINTEIDQAFKFARDSDFPSGAELYDNVYKDAN